VGPTRSSEPILAARSAAVRAVSSAYSELSVARGILIGKMLIVYLSSLYSSITRA
jgi:hypothetical protein